jgi:hypothetical protein
MTLLSIFDTNTNQCPRITNHTLVRLLSLFNSDEYFCRERMIFIHDLVDELVHTVSSDFVYITNKQLDETFQETDATIQQVEQYGMDVNRPQVYRVIYQNLLIFSQIMHPLDTSENFELQEFLRLITQNEIVGRSKYETLLGILSRFQGYFLPASLEMHRFLENPWSQTRLELRNQILSMINYLRSVYNAFCDNVFDIVYR